MSRDDVALIWTRSGAWPLAMRRQRAEKQSAPDDVLNTEKSRRLMAKKVSAWRKKRDQTQIEWADSSD
jgi:hypothetical protein